ncbi:hypothetical protein ABS71_02075 [bacterium SCN 62-11]|nr:hypothetical protein [Candidatus Eremiobacteraeota bacterium]ODT78137.1 MAG: hypothetical protein ABS71_02075 [bacterium SCN 62-11]
MKKLTLRQQEVLRFLDRYRRTYYCSPASREIAAHFGWASQQSAYNHLLAMADKGYVTPVLSAAGNPRGYRLTARGRKSLQEGS